MSRSVSEFDLVRTKSVSPWSLSLVIHAGIAIALGSLIWVSSARVENVSIEVIELPENAAKANALPLLSAPIPKRATPPVPEKRAVLGASRHSITSDDAEAPELKAGNTLAKSPDNRSLRPSDEDLPIPADEINVSQMPQVLNEIRVAYPKAAKQAGVEGAVVFDLLIDATGTVRQMTFVSGLGYGCDEAATEALKKFRFRPAMMNGQPVAVKIRYAYRFVLE